MARNKKGSIAPNRQFYAIHSFLLQRYYIMYFDKNQEIISTFVATKVAKRQSADVF